MNADSFIAPAVALLSLVYAGLSTVKATTTALAPAIEGYAHAPSMVRAGDLIPVTWTIGRHTDCPAKAANIWTGDHDFSLSEPLVVATWPVTRAPVVQAVATKVPDMAPSGKLTLSVEGEYTCPGQPSVGFSLGPVEMMVVKGKE